MKIDAQTFLAELSKQIRGKSNYQANLDHMWGRYNYYHVYKCEVDGAMYFYAHPCKTANTNLSAIKRVCARY